MISATYIEMINGLEIKPTYICTHTIYMEKEIKAVSKY